MKSVILPKRLFGVALCVCLCVRASMCVSESACEIETERARERGKWWWCVGEGVGKHEHLLGTSSGRSFVLDSAKRISTKIIIIKRIRSQIAD